MMLRDQQESAVLHHKEDMHNKQKRQRTENAQYVKALRQHPLHKGCKLPSGFSPESQGLIAKKVIRINY